MVQIRILISRLKDGGMEYRPGNAGGSVFAPTRRGRLALTRQTCQTGTSSEQLWHLSAAARFGVDTQQ